MPNALSIALRALKYEDIAPLYIAYQESSIYLRQRFMCTDLSRPFFSSAETGFHIESSTASVPVRWHSCKSAQAKGIGCTLNSSLARKRKRREDHVSQASKLGSWVQTLCIKQTMSCAKPEFCARRAIRGTDRANDQDHSLLSCHKVQRDEKHTAHEVSRSVRHSRCGVKPDLKLPWTWPGINTARSHLIQDMNFLEQHSTRVD